MYARFLFTALLVLAPAVPRAQGPAPALSRQEAVDIAVRYCDLIGAPLDGEVTATFPADTDIRWQPRWAIRAGGVEVEVVDGSGMLCWFSDPRVGHRFDVVNQPAGPAIDEDDAIRRATVALTAANPPPDLALARARLEQGATPPKAASHIWRVYWDRVFNGIPYRGSDGARVALNAETAEVDGFAIVERTPPPATAAITVGPDAAAAVAFAQMAAARIADPIPLRMQAEVVRPNTQWQPGGNDSPMPGLPRVAWTCMFSSGDTYPVVFVDAATGQVIGGERGAPRGHPTAVALKDRLSTAKRLEVYRRGRNGVWPTKPAAVISGESNRAIFRALRKTGNPAEPPRRFGDHKIAVVGEGDARTDLEYADGLLGLGSQWVSAPKELNDLIAKLDADPK